MAKRKNADVRFAFFGTSDFVIPALEALGAHGFTPALIVTAPDRPRGRGMEVSPSPVKQWAQERGIDTLTPETLKDEGVADELRNTDWDVFIVASYGKILPRAILDIPRHGCLNIHPSLLPLLRGASPFVSAILQDQRETGVTVMLMAEKMDAGPILAQARMAIDEEDWPPPSRVLSDMLFTEGGNLLSEVIPAWLAGELEATPQDESLATYTRKHTKEDAQLDLDGDARANFLKIRAFDVNPRAYFIDERGKRIIVTDAEWKDGSLAITRVIPEGKKEMLYKDYLQSIAKTN